MIPDEQQAGTVKFVRYHFKPCPPRLNQTTGDRNMKKYVLTIVLIIVCASLIFCRETNSTVVKKANATHPAVESDVSDCMDSKLDQWITSVNNKQSAKIRAYYFSLFADRKEEGSKTNWFYGLFHKKNHMLNTTTPYRVILTKQMAINDAITYGIPKEINDDQRDNRKLDLIGLENLEDAGRFFIIANYTRQVQKDKPDNPFASDLYEKTKTGWKKILHNEDPSFEFTVELFRLGKNSPIFLSTWKSDGRFDEGALYLIQEDGKAVKKLEIGGIYGTKSYPDINGDGMAVIVAGDSGERNWPPEVQKEIEKCQGFNIKWLHGVYITINRIYQWDGKEFKLLGNLYFDDLRL